MSGYLQGGPLRLETGRLLLRPYRASDYDAVHAYGSDPEVTRYMSWGPNSPDETRAFLQRVHEASQCEPRTDYDLAIVLRAEHRLVGGCGVYARRLHYREYELGYCIAREAWGRGIAVEAVRALLGFAFGQLGAHRVYASIEPRNAASIRVAEKLGFRREGCHQRDTLVRGQWRDSLVYGLLAEEWPELEHT